MVAMLARLPSIAPVLPGHCPFDMRKHGTHGDLYDCEGHRLPTEGEWGYAARAGIASAHAAGGYLLTGDENEYSGSLQLDKGVLPDDIAIYCGDASCCPSALGSIGANARNPHDMRGNVGWGTMTGATAPTASQTMSIPAGRRLPRTGSCGDSPTTTNPPRFARRTASRRPPAATTPTTGSEWPGPR